MSENESFHKHEVIGRVVSIEDRQVRVDGCNQILRYGYDTIHNISAGDIVKCVYGKRAYGFGWYLVEVVTGV